MIVQKKSGGIVINLARDSIAVITNELGLRVLPKGGVYDEESEEQAAVREIFEETGITKLQKIRKVGVLERPGHASTDSTSADVVKQIHFYLFKTKQATLTPQSKDSIAAEWVPIPKVGSTLSWSEEYAFIKQNCPELFPK
ncbi:NUDIX domain-containing protein [Candidatus Saccharibacteria bacterium]|nr:NUDIX domain-containing protein [Candidatus Saccharibacteria bacterium]